MKTAFLLLALFSMHISLLYFIPEPKPNKVFGWINAILAVAFALDALAEFLA